MIYLDNAATTNYKPQNVLQAVSDCIANYSVNPNRGGSKAAIELERKLYDVRNKISLLVNGYGAERVIFTSGCTAALNLAILGTAKKGHVIVSATEHNSVLRPVMQLYKKGVVDVTVVPPDENGIVTAQSVENAMRKDTYLVCVSQASNVTGTAQNLKEIGNMAQRRDVMLLVDCAQSMGYFPIDMRRCGVSMAAFGAHKGLHGLQGAGALVVADGVDVKPVSFGGTGTESENVYQPTTMPDGYESGTLPCPAIISMGAGIDGWIADWRKRADVMQEMQNTILDGLGRIPEVKLYGKPNKSGIVAFNVGEADSNAVADYLSERYDIATRGGLHCAPLMHKYLQTEKQGVVRASVSFVTTKQECYKFLNAVEQIAKRGMDR